MKKLMAVIAMMALVCSGAAQAELIDTFDSGPFSDTRSGNPAAGTSVYNNHSDAGILGGARQTHMRDGHSGTVGDPTISLAVDDVAGTLKSWGGATAPDMWTAYGSAITAGGGGTPVNLDLAKLLTDTLQVDVVQGTAAGRGDGMVSVGLLCGTDGGGGGGWFWNTAYKAAVGGETASFLLSSFGAITAQDAADIEGIKMNVTTVHGSPFLAEVDAYTIGEIRFGDPAGDEEPIPEPAGLGLVGLALLAVRRRRS